MADERNRFEFNTMTASNVYGPTWYAETMAATRQRLPLTYDIDVDVCVIGAGLAGLTTAREIARRGWSVAVLEAQHVASNASGRSGGFVLPGFNQSNERIIERVGRDRAKALWALSEEGVDYVRTTIRETGMPGVDRVEGWLSVQRIDDRAAIAAEAEFITRELNTEVEIWPVEQVRAALNTQRYFQALHFPGAFHIHPLNYALGLAEAVEKAGAQIYEGTPALAIDPAGVRKRIDVPGARVRAGHIVLAGNTQLGRVFPVVSQSIMPLSSYLAVTAPLGAQLNDAIAYRGGVSDTRRVYEYFRVVGGDRLMWGAHISARLSPPRNLGSRLARDIHKVFPQLGKIEIAHAWSGVMGFALHKMPLIGEVAPGLWVASGFAGHGINTTAMAGGLVARAIVEGDDRWRLFESFDLVWTGGIFGRAAAQMVFWGKRLRDVIDENLARGHEPAAAASREEGAASIAPDDSGPSEPPVGEAEGQAERARPAEKLDAIAATSQRVKAKRSVRTATARNKTNRRKPAKVHVFATRDPAYAADWVKRGRAKNATGAIARGVAGAVPVRPAAAPPDGKPTPPRKSSKPESLNKPE